MKYYFILIWGDVEPQQFGPYGTWDTMAKKAKRSRVDWGDEHGYFWACFDPSNSNPILKFESFAAGII